MSNPVVSITFDEDDLRIFLERLTNYFQELTQEGPSPAMPYMKEQAEDVVLDHSGVITIAGRYQGNVIVTADLAFLTYFFSRIGLSPSRIDLVHDSVGEIANTVAGNLQEKFGSGFIITPPALYRKEAPELKEILEARQGYVLPVTWNKGKANLIALFD